MNQPRQTKGILLNSRGSAVGAVIAGVGALAVIAAFVGLSVRDNALTRNTEAATIRNSQVRLMTIDTADSGCTQRVTKNGDKSVTVCGRVCFSQNYRSGGQDTGKLYLTDVQGSRLHEGNSTFTFGVASIDFPAPCDYVNADIGEAELKNGQATKSNLFNIPLTFDQPLTDSYCPDVYVNYRARVTSGMPFAKVSLRDAGVCTPAPTTAPTAAPQQESPRTTQAPAEPQAGKITGTISVYSCQKPESIGLESCKTKDCKKSEMTPLSFDTSNPTSPVETGIWLEDTNSDNTWVYKYSFANHNSQPVVGGQEYTFKRAFATINSSPQPNSTLYYSQKDESEKLSLKPGTIHDYSISAEKTCGCPFNATAYVRSGTTGEIITDFDKEIATYGTANNKQIIDRGDKPVQSAPFIGGKVVVNAANFVPNSPGGFGEDALASIKLYAPNYTVTKQKCVSTGDVDACPTYAKSYEKEASQLANPNIFENVRVACGVNVEYGWYVLSPTPTPVPIVNGKAEIRMFTWVNSETETPSTCSYDQLTSSIGRGGIYKFLGECELEIFDEAGKSVALQELEEYKADEGTPGCNYHVFDDLPEGKYSLRVGGLTSIYRPKCNENRSFEVKNGQTTKVASIHAVGLDRCDPRSLTESTCDACRSKGGYCLSRYKEGSNERLCCVGSGGDAEGARPPGEDGDGQGECSTDKGLHCSGEKPDNERYANNPQAVCDDSGLGSAYGWCGPKNNACCYSKSSDPGTPPSDPGLPATDPGANPAPGNGDNCNYSDSDQSACNAECSQTCYLSSTFNYCCPAVNNPVPPPEEGNRTPRQPVSHCETKISGAACKTNCGSNEKHIEGNLCLNNRKCCQVTNNTPTPQLAACPPASYPEHTYGPVDLGMKCSPSNGGPGGRAIRSNDGKSYCCQAAQPAPPKRDDRPQYCKEYSGMYSGTSQNCGTCGDDGDSRYVEACKHCKSGALDLFNTCGGGSSCPDEKAKAACAQCSSRSLNQGNEQLSAKCNGCVGAAWLCATLKGAGFTDSVTFDHEKLDQDGNGFINSLDILIVTELMGSSTSMNDFQKTDEQIMADINSDGAVNAIDLSYVISLFGLEIIPFEPDQIN